jgi:hypothetical protein
MEKLLKKTVSFNGRNELNQAKMHKYNFEYIKQGVK